MELKDQIELLDKEQTKILSAYEALKDGECSLKEDWVQESLDLEAKLFDRIDMISFDKEQLILGKPQIVEKEVVKYKDRVVENKHTHVHRMGFEYMILLLLITLTLLAGLGYYVGVYDVTLVWNGLASVK